jgi:FtsP/CotA-like multicopper oxidase with cupredoxin domain
MVGVEEIFLNFGFEPSINNRRWAPPAAPPLTQPASEAEMVQCNDTECDLSAFPNEPCECTHTRSIAFNTTVQLVLTNLGIGAFGMHPVHLHGHHFEVLRIGMPPFHNDTGAVCRWPKGTPHPSCLANDDIECAEGTGCAQAKWKGGVVPPLNLVDPPLKNTVVVPPGGYAVVRFVANNPGWWHLHCHMAGHLASGMGMVIIEAPELLGEFKPPPGFPRCGNFHDSVAIAEHALSARGRWEALVGRS